MDIKRSGSQPSGKGPAEWFTGVVRIDPQNVVASAAVAPYEVLPKEAGLVQLEKSGKIEQNPSGEFVIKDKLV